MLIHINLSLHVCSILMLIPFLYSVFCQVLVIVNSLIGSVYAHFTVDATAVPLIWTTHQSQAKYLNVLRAVHVV